MTHSYKDKVDRMTPQELANFILKGKPDPRLSKAIEEMLNCIDIWAGVSWDKQSGGLFLLDILYKHIPEAKR